MFGSVKEAPLFLVPTKEDTFFIIIRQLHLAAQKVTMSLILSLCSFFCLFETILYTRSYEAYQYYIGFYINPYMFKTFLIQTYMPNYALSILYYQYIA